MNQSIRIIGGLYRGKKITFPALLHLRPTPDRIRETVFNWLMHDIRGANCLDAFAGSGALGFEALSRAAKEVTLIESDPRAFAALQQTAASWLNHKLTLLHSDALDYLKNTQESFDIIFLDPPFHEPHLAASLATLSHNHCLRKGGYLYVESPMEITLDATLWTKRKGKKAGQVFYALFEKC